ncbi:MAG: diacylglycerol kinase family protein [Bacillota bacterium]|nr:diacylglycerol kinase family protein [Bacillota bacterium]MDW7729171.1 diacylglycerol kinase family protein [Bacillota bacterium]
MNKVFKSLKNAYIGLIYCFKTQRNMIIHTLAGLIVIFVGLLLKITQTGMLFLLTAITLVLAAEAFNTSIEKAIDLYTKDRSELAKISKDVAAGAVLLISFFAVIVGLIVLGPPLWHFINAILS